MATFETNGKRVEEHMGTENEELRQLVTLGEKQLEELRAMKENLQTLAAKQEELLRHMLHRLMYAERA